MRAVASPRPEAPPVTTAETDLSSFIGNSKNASLSRRARKRRARSCRYAHRLVVRFQRLVRRARTQHRRQHRSDDDVDDDGGEAVIAAEAQPTEEVAGGRPIRRPP